MHRLVGRVARLMALAGGIVLSLLILLICASVLGRTFNTLLHGWIETVAPAFSAWALGLGIGPITGDFEIVEAGIAFAIFAFIPLCQFSSGHAYVDIFTSRLSARANRVLAMLIEIVFAAVLVLIAVQLFDGMASKRRFGETTFLLQFPVWWSYAASFVAAAIAAGVGVYMAIFRTREWVSGKTLNADGPEVNP